MKIFGASLDPLDSIERINLKLSYLDFLINSSLEFEKYSDPYDIIYQYLVEDLSLIKKDFWIGKIPIESWLTPKPQLDDSFFLSPLSFNKFLNNNGCLKYTEKVSSFVEKEILPHKPVMIGVDHSLTGGVLIALSKRYSNLNVIIFDSHFDVLKSRGIVSQHYGRGGIETLGEADCYQNPFIYECGNFLCFILEKGIVQPQNLWVVGVSETLEIDDSFRDDKFCSIDKKDMRKWIENGVHVLTKTDATAIPLKIQLNGPTYISIDMDVGALASVYSARFMNSFGLTYKEFTETLSALSRIIRQSAIPLIGMDIMEIDIHLLEATSFSRFVDHTKLIVKKIFQNFSHLLNNY